MVSVRLGIQHGPVLHGHKALVELMQKWYRVPLIKVEAHHGFFQSVAKGHVVVGEPVHEVRRLAQRVGLGGGHDQEGGTPVLEQREGALHASKVSIVDPETGKATRVRKTIVDGKKVRVAVASGKTID